MVPLVGRIALVLDGAIELVGQDDGLRIAVGVELMPEFFQSLAQLPIVVDFAVEDYPRRAVLVANRLLTARGIYTPTPRMMISSLTQYNASDHTLSSSVRLRWEYVPGSEFFAVYSDGRNTGEAPLAGLVNRSVALKLTRLLRF